MRNLTIRMAALFCLVTIAELSAQVTYDSNAVVIGAMAGTSLVENTLTAPAGTDRMLIAFVMRDGASLTVSDSITFNGQHLTNQFQQQGNAGLNAEIWYLALGCGPVLTDSVKAYFSHSGGGSLPDVIVAAATFQGVDQFDVFGASQSQFGSGSSGPTLAVNSTDTTGLLIGTVGTESNSGMFTIIATGIDQDEIYETSIPGNNNAAEGNIKAVGGSDLLSWNFTNFCEWVGIGAELLSSDSDGDGVPDCDDACPMDSLKSAPGICGCGLADVDSDGDGTFDCDDLCPLDSLKIDPGICGCGIQDIDADSNGLADCIPPHVTYDSNAVVIGAMAVTSLVEDTLTVPAGNDRMLIAFVMRDGAPLTASDSITFNGQHLTNQFQQQGNDGLNAEVWYLALGCGPVITDSVKAYFSHSGGGSLPDVIVAAATFQGVDQFDVFGDSHSQFGSGSTGPTLALNTTDTTGLLIGTVGTESNSGMFTIIATGIDQDEIYETSIPGNNNASEGNIQEVGGSDLLSWSFTNFCEWVGIAAELLSSDSDGDGVSDCNDACPMDSLKSDPGICGCGVTDSDTDGDGTADCNDLCPLDSLKIDPGICGCGVIESLVDVDMDGTPDCVDLCPFDSLKIDPGICGCGVTDVDTDGDGAVDCLDGCPNDSTLIADMDSDGDGFADCVDPCPYDSAKVDPGLCGCGIPDADSDMDGIPDCSEPGDVLLLAGANPNAKGPVMQGRQISMSGDTALLWALGNRSGQDSTLTFMQFRNDNLYLGAGNFFGVTIDSAGRVGIGMQPSAHRLEVNGSASKATPGNWLANSDARLKTNVLPLDTEQTLSKLLQLQGVTYTWNDNATGMIRPAGTQYGLLAQDIQQVYPRLVVEDTGGYLQTSYGTFDPMILEGIRYIHSELHQLQKESEAMLERLDADVWR